MFVDDLCLYRKYPKPTQGGAHYSKIISHQNLKVNTNNPTNRHLKSTIIHIGIQRIQKNYLLAYTRLKQNVIFCKSVYNVEII